MEHPETKKNAQRKRKPEAPGKWPKQALWSRELFGLDGVVLFLDLDSVITGNLGKPIELKGPVNPPPAEHSSGFIPDGQVPTTGGEGGGEGPIEGRG